MYVACPNRIETHLLKVQDVIIIVRDLFFEQCVSTCYVHWFHVALSPQSSLPVSSWSHQQQQLSRHTQGGCPLYCEVYSLSNTFHILSPGAASSGETLPEEF